MKWVLFWILTIHISFCFYSMLLSCLVCATVFTIVAPFINLDCYYFLGEVLMRIFGKAGRGVSGEHPNDETGVILDTFSTS